MCLIVQFVPKRCPLPMKWTPKHTPFRFLTYLIFAFLTLNTASPAHKEIFGAKFSSFECAEYIVLTHNRLYGLRAECAIYNRVKTSLFALLKSHFSNAI